MLGLTDYNNGMIKFFKIKSLKRESWITDDTSDIQKDFLPEDLWPMLKRNNIDGCIAVQANECWGWQTIIMVWLSFLKLKVSQSYKGSGLRMKYERSSNSADSGKKVFPGVKVSAPDLFRDSWFSATKGINFFTCV